MTEEWGKTNWIIETLVTKQTVKYYSMFDLFFFHIFLLRMFVWKARGQCQSANVVFTLCVCMLFRRTEKKTFALSKVIWFGWPSASLVGRKNSLFALKFTNICLFSFVSVLCAEMRAVCCSYLCHFCCYWLSHRLLESKIRWNFHGLNRWRPHCLLRLLLTSVQASISLSIAFYFY